MGKPDDWKIADILEDKSKTCPKTCLPVGPRNETPAPHSLHKRQHYILSTLPPTAVPSNTGINNMDPVACLLGFGKHSGEVHCPAQIKLNRVLRPKGAFLLRPTGA